MADYTTITDAQVDPEAPITSELMSALRDNPIAIAEAATGAPKIDPRAIDSLLAGPFSNTFSQGAADGSVVLGTVTDLDDAEFLFSSATVTATNPSTVSVRLDRSSNNGSSWGSSITVATVTDTTSADGTLVERGEVLVGMQGFNAVRLVHVYDGSAFSAGTCSNVLLTAGTF